MTTSSKTREINAEQLLIDEFIKDLESTAEKVQTLLEEIRDSKINFAAINAELKFLVDNVKELSSIVKDGSNSGSILTRLALIEHSIIDIKAYIEKESNEEIALLMRIVTLENKVENIILCINDQKNKSANKNITISEADKTGKWKLYVAIATGVFTLLGSLAALIMGLL